MGSNFEKNLDDYVYEDEYYEEEMKHRDIASGDEETREPDNNQEEEIIEVILVCEECTNRWEDIIANDDDEGIFCPVCGSKKVEQI